MAIQVNFSDMTPQMVADSPEVIRMIEQGLTLKIEGVNSNEEPESSDVQKLRKEVLDNTPEISL